MRVSLISLFVVCEFDGVATVRTSASLPAVLPLFSVWTAPPIGFFKLNVDASIHVASSIIGLGALIRDANGAVILSAATKIRKLASVELAEALAIKFGLSLVA
ncbi:hypothetical protein ACOSQ3_023750 [Xanthoceras sorbifolium]